MSEETLSNPLPSFLSSFLLCCLLPDELLPRFLRAPHGRRTTPYEGKKLLSNPLPFFLSSFLPCCLLPVACCLVSEEPL
ncbi:MAG: hypothetical protein F6K31_07755 [Symploca sp. SIO2G7]|nr:hypothetical protein [Symploca sp. SIO2G7]